MHLTYAKFQDPLPTFTTHLFPHPVDSYNECITHLQSIVTLVDIFQPFIHAVGEAEAESLFSELDIAALLTKWEHIPTRIALLRTSHPHLETDINCIMFALGIRVTFFVQSLPTPTVPELKAVGYTWMYNVMMRSTFSFVAEWNQSSREYPRHQLLTLVLAISCARRIVQFYSLLDTDQPEECDFALVPLAEQKMYALGGGPARALSVVQHAFKEEGNRHIGTGGVDNQDIMSLFDPNDLSSMFNLDFSSWDTLFGGVSAAGQAVPTYTDRHDGFAA
jgi:hypothetical protein